MGGGEVEVKCEGCGLIFQTVESTEQHANSEKKLKEVVEKKDKEDTRAKELDDINPNIEGEDEKRREKTLRKLEDIAKRREKIGSLEEVARSSLLEARNRELTPLWPLSKAQKMRECLRAMKFFHKDEDFKFKTAYDTLLTLANNIIRDPNKAEYRVIRLSNADFQEKVGKLKAGVEFLEVWGFEKAHGDFLGLPRKKVDLNVLHSAVQELNYALNNPFFGTIQA